MIISTALNGQGQLDELFHALKWLIDLFICLFSQIPTAVTLSDTAQLGDREVTVGETRSTTPTCQKIVKNPVAPAKPA